MKGTMFEYEVTIYRNHSGEEDFIKGVVFAKTYGEAADIVTNEYSYKDSNNDDFNIDICDIKLTEVLDNYLKETPIYEFKN